MSARNHKIGGTNAATLLGIGRESQTVLYLKLRGEIPEFEGNEATEAGQIFEDGTIVPLAKKRLGLDLVRPDERVLVHPDDPRLGASLDFEVWGENAFADAKLTSWREKWGNDLDVLPMDVAAQMQWQMAMARARGRAVPVVHVIAFMLPGYILRDFPVQEDVAIGEHLVGLARNFLQLAENGTPPKPENEVDARLLYMARQGGREATAEEVALVRELREVQDQRKQAESREKAIRDLLVPAIGEHSELLDADGKPIVTYAPNSVFDEAAFRAQYPEYWHAAVESKFSVTKAKAAIGARAESILRHFRREPLKPSESTRVLRIK